MARAESVEQASGTAGITKVSNEISTSPILPYYCSWYRCMFPRPGTEADDDSKKTKHKEL